MDNGFNWARRRRELDLANRIASEYLAETSLGNATPDLLLHLFEKICEDRRVILGNDGFARVFRYVDKKIQRVDGELDRSIAAVNGAASF